MDVSLLKGKRWSGCGCSGIFAANLRMASGALVLVSE